MHPLTGIWRLVESRAWDHAGNSLRPPYGGHPIGQIVFTNDGRMLSAVCNGDPDTAGGIDRGYSSYGGNYTFVDGTLTTSVDIASDKRRIGSDQVREAELTGDRLVLRPPEREYGGVLQKRELVWERVWRPAK